MKRISAEFAVRFANGNRQNRAVGFAPIATRPNISTAVVGRVGIRLKPAAFVRLALTVGFGHRVCGAAVGQNTMLGMKKIRVRVFHNLERECSIQTRSDFW